METLQNSAGVLQHYLRGLPASFWYIVTISTGLALLIVLVMAVLGYRDGLRRGEAQTRQQVAILLQRASDMLDAGMHDEARTVYTRILEFDPQNEAASSAISAVDAIDTTETVPEIVSEPTATDLEWSRALALYEEGRWQEAIQRFSLVQSMQPDYRSDDLQQKLFVSNVELARAAIAEGNLEEAVQLFDSALELDANNAQVQEERYMIAHYVDVKTYWGADWTQVIRLLVDLTWSIPITATFHSFSKERTSTRAKRLPAKKIGAPPPPPTPAQLPSSTGWNCMEDWMSSPPAAATPQAAKQ